MSDLRRLHPFIRPYLPLLVLALLLLSASAVLEAGIVAMLEPIFDHLNGQGAAQGSFSGLFRKLGISPDDSYLRIPALLIFFALLKGVLLYFAEYAMNYTGQSVVAVLRNALHRHLLGQATAFYTRYPTGQLISRIITDTERIQQTVSRTLADAGRQSLLLVVFMGVLLYIDWKLTIATFLLVPPVLWITLRLGSRLRRVASRSQQNLSDLSQSLTETISGQRIVKAFTMEDYEQSRFEKLIRRLVHNNMKVAKIGALSSPLVELIGYLALAPLLVYFNYAARNAEVTPGSLAIFIVSLFRLYDPLRKLSRMHLHFQQAFASSSRIFALLDEAPEIQENPDAQPLPPIRRNLRFEDVGLLYPEQAQPALSGIDLTISRGELVALVGPSGAGKSSLVGLIPRFYDPNQGRISIDGHDLRDVTLESLRRQTAFVSQEIFLFDDTIRHNIAYGQADRPMKEIEAAAKAAYIHDFIVSLPSGYDTLVGERGQKLSGGQRQRLAIARAALKQAPILILDEATSSLDTESERLVQKALYNLMKHSTTLVIAHRLSTVRRADRIVVLDGGRIREVGDHQALMKRSGLYRRLYEMQFEDEEIDLSRS